MKKLVLALTFLILATTCYSQTPDTTPTSTQGPSKGTKEYYLEKREANMVRGWIFTPAGVGLLGLSFAMAWAETATAVTSFGTEETDGSSAGLVAVAGLGSIIAGTISFVSAGSNKRKARALAVGYEQLPLPQQATLMTKAVPTVGLKIVF